MIGLLHGSWAHGEAEHGGGECVVGQSCSPPGAGKQRRETAKVSIPLQGHAQ